LAKVAAATGAVVAATGGLGAAGALPAPFQRAISHIGIGGAPKPARPQPDHPTPRAPHRKRPTPTTTRAERVHAVAPERNGTEVSGRGGAPEQGCDQRPPCSSTKTTIASARTPTSTRTTDTNDHPNESGDKNAEVGNKGAQSTSPTTADGADDGSDHGGDANKGDQPSERNPADNSGINDDSSGG
jgi:hypothetical protein